MEAKSFCACGCGSQTNNKPNGESRAYLKGHNRRGTGKGWRECGYWYISVDGKKIAEHRYLVEQDRGSKLTRNEVVHHIDGNQMNNDLANLMVLTKAEHSRLHSRAKRTRWTEAEKERARELKAAGYSTQDIALILGRSVRSTIRYACNRRGQSEATERSSDGF